MNTEYMNLVKRIAIVADDARKNDLIEWSFHHREVLKRHQLIAAAYTADVLEGTVSTSCSQVRSRKRWWISAIG
jgi:methylglyoxal synthase